MIFLLIIILFSVAGMKALFHPGLFTAHDIWHQVVRFYYYSQGVNDGQFPPYWIATLANGFGYPLFFFSYHLPWIIGMPFLIVGFDIPSVMKILFFLSYLGSGISMYFFVLALFKNKLAATGSAILYLWLPYHFLIIFVGASMGIAFVFTFLPLLFLGIHLTSKGSRWGIPVLAAALSAIILSHIMHLVFLFPVILIYFIWELTGNKKRLDFLKNTAFGLILGILLSSFYFIPALYYSKFTRISQETGFSELYKRHFINFKQLIYSKWGYGPIVNNAKNGENSFQLGFSQWLSILSLFLLLISKKINRKYLSLSISLLTTFSINIFLMLDYSGFIWRALTKIASVDYPFRLLLPSAFIASICSAVVYVNLGRKMRFLFLSLLIILALYSNRNHIRVNQYTDFPISAYLEIETEKTTNTFNEYLPLKANPSLLNKPWNEITASASSAINTRRTTNSLAFDLNSKEKELIPLGQFYFPGQSVYLDGKKIKPLADKEGRMSVHVEAGNHKLEVKFEETTLIKASKILTIAGLLLAFFFGKNFAPKKP